MNPFLPPLLVIFFSVFHILGGSAIGQGLRAVRRGSDMPMFLFLFGAVMGGLPLVFDWVFLIAQGYVLHGLIGPILFLVAAFAGALLELKIDGGAVMSTVLGSVALLIGLFSIPLMLDAAKDSNPAIEDYAFGGCFVLLFVLIGGSVAWNGLRAMVRGVSLDQEYAEQAKCPRRRKKSMGITVRKYWE